MEATKVRRVVEDRVYSSPQQFVVIHNGFRTSMKLCLQSCIARTLTRCGMAS